MTEKVNHISPKPLKEKGVKVHSLYAGDFSPILRVNIDPKDKKKAVKVLEKYGYEITATETLEDSIDGEKFVRISTLKEK